MLALTLILYVLLIYPNVHIIKSIKSNHISKHFKWAKFLIKVLKGLKNDRNCVMDVFKVFGVDLCEVG